MRCLRSAIAFVLGVACEGSNGTTLRAQGSAARLSSTLQLDFDSYAPDSVTRRQVGAMPTVGAVRTLRPRIDGDIPRPFAWSYVLAFDVRRLYRRSAGATVRLNQLAITVPTGSFAHLSIGRQAEGVEVQVIESRADAALMERSPSVTAFLPTRNDGLRLWNTALEERLSWSIGAFNSFIRNRLPFDKNGSQFTGRVTGLPVLSEDSSALLHVALSGRYSGAQEDSLRYRSRPQANAAPEFIDTKQIPAIGATTTGYEVAVVRGPLSASSSGLLTWVAQPHGSARFYGDYFEVSWFPRGERRRYVASSGSFGGVEMGDHLNTFEIAAQYNLTNLTNGDIDGGVLGRGTLAASWYRDRGLRAEVNLGYARLQRFGLHSLTPIGLARLQWQAY